MSAHVLWKNIMGIIFYLPDYYSEYLTPASERGVRSMSRGLMFPLHGLTFSLKDHLTSRSGEEFLVISQSLPPFKSTFECFHFVRILTRLRFALQSYTFNGFKVSPALFSPLQFFQASPRQSQTQLSTFGPFLIIFSSIFPSQPLPSCWRNFFFLRMVLNFWCFLLPLLYFYFSGEKAAPELD